MVQFIIFLGIILTAGPGHNEGGFDAVKAKGLSAFEDAFKAGDVPQADHLGNYGNK